MESTRPIDSAEQARNYLFVWENFKCICSPDVLIEAGLKFDYDAESLFKSPYSDEVLLAVEFEHARLHFGLMNMVVGRLEGDVEKISDHCPEELKGAVTKILLSPPNFEAF